MHSKSDVEVAHLFGEQRHHGISLRYRTQLFWRQRYVTWGGGTFPCQGPCSGALSNRTFNRHCSSCCSIIAGYSVCLFWSLLCGCRSTWECALNSNFSRCRRRSSRFSSAWLYHVQTCHKSTVEASFVSPARISATFSNKSASALGT